MIEAVISFFTKAWGYIATGLLARGMTKRKAAEDAIKAYKTRQKVSDNIGKLDLDERKRLLKRKWSVRRVEKDNSD